MHPAVFQFVQRVVRELPPRRRVVEIGSLDVNGSVRSLFRDVPYVGVDIREGRGVDVIGDGATYEPEEPPDTVLCLEVLEHAENARGIVDNALAMLGRGGVLILTCAAPDRQPHGWRGESVGSEFYRNVSPDDLRAWLRFSAWADVEHDPSRGDLYAVCEKE